MKITRRQFAHTVAGTLAATALPLFADERKPLSILVLGGSKFLGPALIEPALARGHKVAMFNRGKTNPELFPPVEKLRGDRDPAKGEGIKALEGRRFDVIYDDTGYYPRHVRASAQALAKAGGGHYVFVSSISVYKDFKQAGADETYPVGTMQDPALESMGANFENYGPLKALCEAESRAAFGERTTIVRPGYIVGPGDPSDRFTWYPLRASQGGEMLAPGAPSDPVQIIDVRDLGEWMLRLGERQVYGTFNACGPRERLTMGETLAASLAASRNDTRLTWVPADFLRTQGEDGEGKIPIWAPPDGNSAGAHTTSNLRAQKAGLTFRPVATTVKDTLEWFRTQPAERQASLKGGFTSEDEAKLLAAWHARAA